MEIVLGDASEPRQPLANEAMAVLTAVEVSIADDVRVIVRNGEMSVNLFVFVDVIVDRVVVCTQNHRTVT